MPGEPATLPSLAQPTSLAPGHRPLPTDPKELDGAIAPYKVMVAPVLLAFSRLLDRVAEDPLTKPEIEMGELSFGALLYQMGGTLDARVLVALWCVSILATRIPSYLEKRAVDKRKATEAELLPKAA